MCFKSQSHRGVPSISDDSLNLHAVCLWHGWIIFASSWSCMMAEIIWRFVCSWLLITELMVDDLESDIHLFIWFPLMQCLDSKLLTVAKCMQVMSFLLGCKQFIYFMLSLLVITFFKIFFWCYQSSKCWTCLFCLTSDEVFLLDKWPK